MDDPIQRYRTKSRDRQRHRRKSLRSIERLQYEVYKTKQTISSATDYHQGEMSLSQQSRRSRRRGSNVKGESTSSCHGASRSQRDVHQLSRSRGRCRERSTQQQSRSKSVRSRSKSLRRKIQQLTPTRRICVDRAPFDKNGRCFVHNNIKLASRKLLGGWKIHFRFCPKCAEDYDNDDSYSVISDISGLSVGSFISGCESRSYKSMNSQRSWSSKQSKKRIDDSFLPLDEDGYCLRHPDVQLAEICRKGGWNVLLDFCPGKKRECLLTAFQASIH